MMTVDQGIKQVFGNGRARRRRNSAGFTIIEVLVVLAIIGLIVSLIGPRLFNQLGSARVKTAAIQMESISAALDLFYLDTGRYPTAAEGLSALALRPGDAPNWNGPYLRGSGIPKDPWSNDFVYRAPGRDSPYDLISYGSDGREGGEGTAADIVLGARR